MVLDFFRNSGFVAFEDYFDRFSIQIAGVISTFVYTASTWKAPIGIELKALTIELFLSGLY